MKKDRLARFGYEYLDAIFSNLEIIVEIMEVKDKKYEEELAEDIMKILTCYSARYYGARGGRKKKNKETEMKELSYEKWEKEIKEVINNTNKQIAEYQKKAKSDWEAIMSSSEVSFCTDSKSKVEF